MRKLVYAAAALLFAVACGPKEITEEKVFSLKGGEISADITNFGARIMTLNVPDKDGNTVNVQLGFPTVAEYHPEVNPNVYGALVGRFANRIANGLFTLDGVEYQLERNHKGHCLHGGAINRWSNDLFTVEKVTDSSIRMRLVSPDGDQGFPGTVTCHVTYTLTANNDFEILYEAETDKATVLNITNHSFFNLGGSDESHDSNVDILYVNAEKYAPADTTGLPTGELLDVEGTVYDLRTPKVIADGPYDNNFVIANPGDDSVVAAELYNPENGVVMTVRTTEPGVQVYVPRIEGKGRAVCLETQHYPDSPHHEDWPTTVLRPGEKYVSRTVYSFSVR